MCVDLYILERNAAGSLESGERDRSLQEPIPLPAQQGSSRGVRFWRALFSLGHRVDNLKDPFRNSDLSCMYWSAVKGHEVSIETAETLCNQLAMAGHRFAPVPRQQSGQTQGPYPTQPMQQNQQSQPLSSTHS